jgi:hypothetical protein
MEQSGLGTERLLLDCASLVTGRLFSNSGKSSEEMLVLLLGIPNRSESFTKRAQKQSLLLFMVA